MYISILKSNHSESTLINNKMEMEISDNCNNITMENLEKCVNNIYTNTNDIHTSGTERLITMTPQIKIIVDDNVSENVMKTESENIQTNNDVVDENENESVSGSLANQLNNLVINQIEEDQIIMQLVDGSQRCDCTKIEQSGGMRIAFGIVLRFMLPIANVVMRRFKGIRDARFLRTLKSIASSRQVLANLMAFAANSISMNLSSAQVSQRIGPILELFKLRKSTNGIESFPDSPFINNVPFFPTIMPPTPPPTPTTPATFSKSHPFSGLSPFMRVPSNGISSFVTTQTKPIKLPPQPAPKCCSIKILAEPPPGQPIRADIVFIHGLHGSVTKTWKQGLWENDRQPVSFERPPKPPVRPPKRPKHTRTVFLYSPHKEKRARFAHNETNQRNSNEDDMMEHVKGNDLDDGFFDATEQELCNSSSYFCGPPKDIHNYNDIEYSFPTFRLRLNDNGRQIQSEYESLDTNSSKNNAVNSVQKSPSQQFNCDRNSKSATKTDPNDDPNYAKCWPSEWLPLDCPGVRVVAINYTTDQYLWRPLWKKKEPRSSLIERAREMTELLIKHRVGYGQPIVWVGHSKGGLFIKQIIVDAWESGRPAVAPLWRYSRGVFFYSVPHRGAHLACIKAPLLERSIEMLDIEKNNKYLLDLHRRFAGLYYLGHIKIEVFSFVETALTLMSVLYLRIVGVDSADPGFGDVCGIRLDHREICKPRSRDCILYKELVKMIKKVC